MIFCCLDNWVTDPNTGKEYIVLDTSTHHHDINQETCRNIGGHLPEPRNQQENLFLNSLGSDQFILGINDQQTEGHWVFDTDGSPVTWFSWVDWRDYTDPPKQGRDGNCAIMLRQWQEGISGHRPQDWGDTSCNTTAYRQGIPKSLICQKYTGG